MAHAVSDANRDSSTPLAAIAAWLLGAPSLWLTGGLLLAAVIPFTLIVILSTNKRLLDPSLDKNSEQAHRI